MNFIESFKERQKLLQKKEIEQQARYRIRVLDFENTLYLAYDGIPLIKIQDDWTQKEILDQLSILRGNFIKARNSNFVSSVI